MYDVLLELAMTASRVPSCVVFLVRRVIVNALFTYGGEEYARIKGVAICLGPSRSMERR